MNNIEIKVFKEEKDNIPEYNGTFFKDKYEFIAKRDEYIEAAEIAYNNAIDAITVVNNGILTNKPSDVKSNNTKEMNKAVNNLNAAVQDIVLFDCFATENPNETMFRKLKYEGYKTSPLDLCTGEKGKQLVKGKEMFLEIPRMDIVSRTVKHKSWVDDNEWNSKMKSFMRKGTIYKAGAMGAKLKGDMSKSDVKVTTDDYKKYLELKEQHEKDKEAGENYPFALGTKTMKENLQEICNMVLGEKKVMVSKTVLEIAIDFTINYVKGQGYVADSGLWLEQYVNLFYLLLTGNQPEVLVK